MRITKKIISLLLVVSMLASFFAMTGFEASAALTGQQKTDFGIHFDDTTRKLKVLQLPDIQSSVSDSSITQRTKDTIRLLMMRYDPDVILLTGDQTQGGSTSTKSRWESTLDKVFATFTPYMRPDCAIIAMPGNHEYDFGSLDHQYDYYTNDKGCVDWDNNFSTIDLNGAPGAGNVAVSASSTNKAVALNFAIFNSKGDDEDGYLRPGGDDDNAYMEIVNWYTNMNNTLASSQYSYKAQVTGQSSALVPTFASQHVILQEIFTTGAIVAGNNLNGIAMLDRYKHLNSNTYIRLDPNNNPTGVMGEVPCPSTLGAGATRALYDALNNPGNLLGMTFGHDHDNYFDVVDDNGFHFYMGGALTQENYNTDQNPKARYFEFTLNDATGDVVVTSEVKAYTQLTLTSSADVDSDRIEVLNGEGVQFAHTLSTPKVVYVGSSANIADPRIKQEFGNVVQPQLLDYKTKTPYNQDLDVKFCLPNGATNVQFHAVRSSNETSATITDLGTEDTDEGTLYKKKITPESALTAGEKIKFAVTYTYGGENYEIHNVTYVEDIKQPAGFNSWFRGWRESNNSKNYVDLAYVATLSGTSAYSTARAFDVPSNTDHYKFNTYYDYSLMQSDIDYAYTNHAGDTSFSMFRWSPTRVQVTEGLVAPHGIADGLAARTDIYLDYSALKQVSATDTRLDTGVSIDFWVPKGLDRGFSEYVAGIGFYEGDHGFDAGGATIDPSDPYANYNVAVTAENNSTGSGGTIDEATIFLYNSYAKQESLYGLGTTHENGNTVPANRLGNTAGEYVGYPLVVDSKQAAKDLNGKDMTMYTGVRNKGSSDGGYRILLYDVAPYYLYFQTYDKSALRELTMGELMNPRMRSDYPSTPEVDELWSKYIMAYESALTTYAQSKITQDSVDTSYDALRGAIAALLDSSKVADPNLELKGDYGFGSVSVPPILYVSGSTIQTADPYTDLAISFTVPSGAVAESVKVVAINNDSAESTNSAVSISGSLSGTTWTGKVDGGTATAGGAVYYKLTFEMPEDKNKDGKNDEYQQYAASYVRGTTYYQGIWKMRNITRNNRDRDDRRISIEIYYDSLINAGSVLGVRGASAVVALYPVQGTDSFEEAVSYPTSSNVSEGHLSGGAGDEGWAIGTSLYHDYGADRSTWREADKVMFYNDRSAGGVNVRAHDKAYWAGLQNQGGQSAEYIVVHYFYNKQAVSSSTKLQTTITHTHRGYKDGDTKFAHFTQDHAGRESWSNSIGSYYGTSEASSTPDPSGNSGGTIQYASGSLTGNLTSSGQSLSAVMQNAFDLTSVDVEGAELNKRGVREAAGYHQRWKYRLGYEQLWVHEDEATVYVSTGIGFKYNAVDRSKAQEYIGYITNKDITGFNKSDMDPQWWNDWRQECFDAYVAWGNLWGSDFDSTRILELYTTPKFKLADYSKLVEAVNKATNAGLVVNTGTNAEPSANANESITDYSALLFNVHPDDDSRYAGLTYDKTMFVNNAADLIKTIEDRLAVAYSGNANDALGTAEENHLDFRYQPIIDDYTKTINEAYARLRLKGADYTEFDKYANCYDEDADTILFMRDMQAAYNSDGNARNHANEKALPSGVYTSASRNAFINAISIDRTLKKPSETTVIGSLPRIYPDPNGFTFKYPEANANKTDCLYNKARDAYEDLEFRRAGEYYQANGQWTDANGVTYYANYNKTDRGASYLYTPVFKTSYNELSADITDAGYVVTDNKVKETYNRGNNGDTNGNGTYDEGEIWVTNGKGEYVKAIATYTDASWGTTTTYGFSQAYENNLLNVGCNYKTTNSSDKYILALYAESQILPQIAAVDYYYDKLAYSSYDMTQLDIQQKEIFATYEKGSDKYDSLAGYEILDENGNVLTDGAQWYTADTWAEYLAAKVAQPAIIDGATLAENQAAINYMTQMVYQKRAALQLRTMEDYRTTTETLGETDFASINAKAEEYYNEVNNKKVKVFALRANDPASYAAVAGNEPLFKDHNYYTDSYITTLLGLLDNDAGTGVKDFAGKPMAENIEAYLTAVNTFKTKYDQNSDPANLNKADTSTLKLLLNKTWIPTYDKYGAGNYNNGNWLIGSEFDGSKWYSNWDQYDQARKNALAFFNSTEFDGQKVAVNLTHYGNQVPAGDFYVDMQGAQFTVDKDPDSPTYRQPVAVDGSSLDGMVNKVAYDLVVAYYTLKLKSVSDSDDTIGTVSGYENILLDMENKLANLKAATIDVYFIDSEGNLVTSGDDVKRGAYDENYIAQLQAYYNTVEGLGAEVYASNYATYIQTVQSFNTMAAAPTSAKVYFDGWNSLYAYLTAQAREGLSEEDAAKMPAITDAASMNLYFTYIFGSDQYNPANDYNGDYMPIQQAITQLGWISPEMYASTTQASVNTYLENLYKDLTSATTVSVPTQIKNATTQAQNVISNTSGKAYDPLQLNNRPQATGITEYTQDSMDALNAVIRANGEYKVSFWDAQPVNTGYNNGAGVVVDGIYADNMWAAAGLTTEGGVTYEKDETNTINERYVLRQGGRFIDALQDAYDYAVDILYTTDENGDLVYKSFTAVSGDGEREDKKTLYTQESIDDLVPYLEQAAAVLAETENFTSQANVDILVFNILEQTDDTLFLCDSEGNLYNGYTTVGEDDGLVKESVNLIFLVEELATKYSYEDMNDTAQDLINQVWGELNDKGVYTLDNTLGGKYFDNWNDYSETYVIAKVKLDDTTLTPDNQNDINTLVATIYNTRNALSWKVIGDTDKWNEIWDLGGRIDNLRGEVVTIYTFTNSTLVPAEESPDGMAYFTKPTWDTKDVYKYGAAETAEIIAMWDAFQAEYNYDDPYTRYDELVSIYSDLYNMYNDLVLNGQKQLSIDGEFAEGYIDLVENFIAGTFNGETRKYESDYLAVDEGTQIMTQADLGRDEAAVRNAQQKFIEDKLCQIYDLLKGGNINSYHSIYGTSLDAINAYTMELYEYLIGTPAQYAGFALDLRQDIIDYLSTTITASVKLRYTAVPTLYLYTETVYVFDQGFKDSKIEEINLNCLDEISNWPKINMLNASVGLLDAINNEEADFNTFVYTVYDENMEFFDEVLLNSLMENLGSYAPAYNEATSSVSTHVTQHLNWITTKAVVDGEETGDKTYVLGGPANADSKAYYVYDELTGPTFAYAMDVNNADLDGDWYTKGYGENVMADIDGDGIDEMYYIAAGDKVTGSEAGGWFTDTSYNALRTALNNAKNGTENADGTVSSAPVNYAMFGDGDAAQAKIIEIQEYADTNGLSGPCWSSDARAQYIAALQADQKSIDNATADIYEALMGLELLNAVDAYREVAGLIYAALGYIAQYDDANTTDAIITDELVGELVKFTVGDDAETAWGRLFNMELVGDLGEQDVDYVVISDEDGDKYYSPKLPTSYTYTAPDGKSYTGRATVEAILTMLQSEMSPMLTVDKSRDVNGDEGITVKTTIVAELEKLQLSKADTSKIKSLTAAFVYNNPANSQALGSYDYNGDGANFFKSEHSALAADGTNAGEYRNSEIMKKSSLYNESGFYDFTLYEDTTLKAVLTYMKDNNIITSATQSSLIGYDQSKETGFDLVFDYQQHGGIVFDLPSTKQQEVNEIYAGLVDVINALKLKSAVTDELDKQAEEADAIELQKDIYDEAAVNPETGKTYWEEFETAKAEADKYANATIINQDQVDAAAEELALAIKKLVLNVDTYSPIVSVHTTKDELDAFYNSHPELKNALGTNTLTPVTYAEKNVGNYALYVYTNQLNPQIVISAQDIDQLIENNASRKVSISKPEKINIVSGATSSTISADIIVPHIGENGVIDGVQEFTPNTAAGIDTQTARGSDGTYAKDSSAYVVLNPKFDASKPATQQAVQYIIDATDSAQTKAEGSGELVSSPNSSDSIAYVNGTAEEAVLADGKIKIFVYYMNAMPEDGNDSGVVTDGEGNRVINSAAVLTVHEYKSLAADKWTNHAMLYRSFPDVLKSWEFSDNEAQLATKGALYSDPTFGENNFGSFVYVLDKDADESSLDYKVAQEYYSTNSTEAAKQMFIDYLNNGIVNSSNNNTTYLAEFKSKIADYSGFMTYGAYTNDGQYENWAKGMGTIDNGTLVFVHVADRFGNVCNRFIEWNYYDYKAPTFGTVSDGHVNVTEDGGSGIANIDLFTYRGTSGGSLYSEYHLSKGFKIQEIAGQISYVSDTNEYVVENLEAGARYTVAVKDGAGNVGSAHVRADADGKLTISATVEYTNAVQYGKDAAAFAMQSGEDLGVIDFVFNSNETIVLNYIIPSSIVKAGPDGNVFANDATEPLNIYAKSEVEAIKLYNAATGEEEIWTSENAKIKDNGDGTNKWTVKYSFAEGEHNYTATAMVNGEWESTTVDFSFTATTKSVKISFVNTGLGRTEYSYNDGLVKKLSSTDVLIAPYGSVVNVKATSTRTGSDFLYWKNNSTDRIISTADSMEFVAVTNLSLTSQFTTTAVLAENKKLVVYVNNAENVVDSFEVAQGGNYTVPDAPALADHVFKEWSMTKDEVLASEDNFIVVKPVYSLVVTNTVTLTEGNWTATGAGEYQSIGNARAAATISASDVNEDGAGFLYWLDAETGDIVSYNRTYTFNVVKDTELTPVYGDASAVVPVPVARITTIKFDSKTNAISFYAERSTPAGYDLIQTGIIVTTSAETGTDESAFVVDATGTHKGMSKQLTANGLYSFSAQVTTKGTTVYARAYSICMNADGDFVTIYSPISSYTA